MRQCVQYRLPCFRPSRRSRVEPPSAPRSIETRLPAPCRTRPQLDSSRAPARSVSRASDTTQDAVHKTPRFSAAKLFGQFNGLIGRDGRLDGRLAILHLENSNRKNHAVDDSDPVDPPVLRMCTHFGQNGVLMGLDPLDEFERIRQHERGLMNVRVERLVIRGVALRQTIQDLQRYLTRTPAVLNSLSRGHASGPHVGDMDVDLLDVIRSRGFNFLGDSAPHTTGKLAKVRPESSDKEHVERQLKTASRDTHTMRFMTLAVPEWKVLLETLPHRLHTVDRQTGVDDERLQCGISDKDFVHEFT